MIYNNSYSQRIAIFSFAGNSAILRRSCYKEVTFYLTINVFWSQQHIVQRKSFIVCMLVKFFTKNVYPQSGNHPEYRNVIIITNAHEIVNIVLFFYGHAYVCKVT